MQTIPPLDTPNPDTATGVDLRTCLLHQKLQVRGRGQGLRSKTTLVSDGSLARVRAGVGVGVGVGVAVEVEAGLGIRVTYPPRGESGLVRVGDVTGLPTPYLGGMICPSMIPRRSEGPVVALLATVSVLDHRPVLRGVGALLSESSCGCSYLVGLGGFFYPNPLAPTAAPPLVGVRTSPYPPARSVASFPYSTQVLDLCCRNREAGLKEEDEGTNAGVGVEGGGGPTLTAGATSDTTAGSGAEFVTPPESVRSASVVSGDGPTNTDDDEVRGPEDPHPRTPPLCPGRLAMVGAQPSVWARAWPEGPPSP